MTTRRDFFKLAIGAAALTAIPAPVAAAPIPTIYADGIHCDAAGLRALASGEAVEILRPDVLAGTGWRDGSLHISGNFHTLETVKIEGIDVNFGGCSFSKLPGFPNDEPILQVDSCGVTFQGPFRGGDRWAGFEPRWRIKVADADYISAPPPSIWGWGDDGAEASRPITPPKPPKKPKALRGR